MCGGFSVVLQIGLVLALLFAFEELTKKIVDPKQNQAKYDQGEQCSLSTGRLTTLACS